jgi:hypothetical protein
MMGTTVLLVFVVSVLIYAQTESYGEAALALVAGLLTAFTVEWTSKRFIAFVVCWVGLSLVSLVIASVKLAATKEEILVDAANTVDPDRREEVQASLEDITDDDFVRMLGPIERASVIRLFAFRKLDIESMRYALRAVELLSTVTNVDYEIVAEFVVDIYKVFGSTPGPRYQRLLDRVHHTIRDSAVSPREFMAAFRDSRFLVLSGNVDSEAFFQHLVVALNSGVAPEDIREYLQGRLE